MKKILICFATLCLVASCAPTKETAIRDLRDLCKEVEAHGADYGADEWNRFLADYQRTDSLLNVHLEEYSEEQLEEIGRLKGECAAYAVKAAASEGFRQIRKAAGQAKGALDGFLKGLSNDKK